MYETEKCLTYHLRCISLKHHLKRLFSAVINKNVINVRETCYERLKRL